ncbi:TonB-dependent receptor [Salinisphaera sp. Q1T1-3]|uniref:TonB-dependent receptor n=1 Tax=Salinisphaera sp. Q1T1-3 TaxID=2321229 RepID=UPI000E7301B4|nr:TonB-dependent receptor [Salinisphaera sp. Q1T1-3]RJS93364.1 TonB-dependent receptor [Salinisphaera sp. Q1T1-3]
MLLPSVSLAANPAPAAAPAPAAPSAGSAASAPTSRLDTVSVTGVPIPGSPLSQAAEVDVVNSSTMSADGAANLGQGLSHLPGVDSIGTGNVAGKPVIRGLSGERVKILSNDIGVSSQSFGVRHMPVTDPFLLDRVEVVRGASSVLYGSSALGGAINLMPLDIDYDARAKGELLGRYDSNNREWDTGLKATGGNGHFGYAAGLIRRDGGDIRTPDEATYFPGPDAAAHPDAPAYTGRLKYTDFNQINGTVAVGMQDKTLGDWRLAYSRWNDEHNYLLPPPAGIKPPPAGQEGVGQFIDDRQVQLTGHKKLAGIDWKPNLMWQNNRRRSNAGGYPRHLGFDGDIDLQFDQYTARLTGQHGAVLGLSGGTIGVEYVNKQQVSRGRTQLSPGGEVNNAAVFAFEEKDLGKLTLQAGLRYDYHDVEALSGKTANPSTSVRDADKQSYNVVTGSIGGVYAFTDHLSLAANVGRGFRAPTLFELYVAGQHGGVAAFQRGNPDLDPETSLDTSLSLRWESDRISAELTGYRNAIDDYIYLQSTGTMRNGLPVFDHDQADAELYGAEGRIQAQLTDWVSMHVKGEVVRGRRRDNHDDLPLIPADNVGIGARFTPHGPSWPRKTYASIDLTYHDSHDAAPGEPFSQFDTAPFGRASTSGYGLVDVGAGVAPKIGGHEVQLDLRVHNLFDKPYRDFLDTYKGYALSPGRDIRLTTTIPFDI